MKVTDLGLARAFADAKSTRAGAVTGTVQYLSPEQIRGEPADPRSDLYSLGIVGYELLTDRVPFTGETPMAIAYKHLSDRVPAPSAAAAGVPADLDALHRERDRSRTGSCARSPRPRCAATSRRSPRTWSARGPSPRLVSDVPRVVHETGADADADATAALPQAAITQTIPQPGTHRRRRRGRTVVVVLLAIALVAAAAWGAWTYVIPHHHPVPTVTGLRR